MCDSMKLKMTFYLMSYDAFEFVEGMGYACGIIVAWKINNMHLVVEIKHFKFMHLRVCFENGKYWKFTPIYASPLDGLRHELWNFINMIEDGMNDSWLIASDFNDVIS